MVWYECALPFKCEACKDRIENGEFYQDFVSKLEKKRYRVCGSCWSQLRGKEVG